MRRRRPDAVLAEDVPAYRRMMPFILRGRNESVVYFSQEIDVTNAEALVRRLRAERPELHVTLFHLVLWAGVQAVDRRPHLNRFVAGGRIWQRDGIWITYAAKTSFDDDAPLVTLKRRFDPRQPFLDMVGELTGDLRARRGGQTTTSDRELDVLLRLPPPLLRIVVAAARRLDALGLLPRWFVEGDPFYATAVVANLGSLDMDAAVHHLYEYGTASIFTVVGRAATRPDGRRVMTIQWSFDERIEDGWYAYRTLELIRELLEDPLAAGILGGESALPPARAEAGHAG
jgi:hypothetical protein